MAENDSHYNDTNTNMPAAMPADDMDNDFGLTTPLPDFEEGNPAYSGDEAMIPLPDVGEGGPVFPGNMNPGADVPVTPLPFPGEGGPVFPGNNTGGNIPVVPLPFPNTPSNPNLSPQFFGQVRFLNASTNTFPVNITVDGVPYAVNSRFATISNYDWISDGFHTITVRRAIGLRNHLLPQTFSFAAGQRVTMVLTDSASGGLEMVRIVDTGCTNMPFNSACYRFANMAYSGSSFDLSMTGGDVIFRNVRFQNVTTYKQAVAGTYQFSVSNSGTFTFIRELPIIMIGAVVGGGIIQQPLINFTVTLEAGRSYTSYIVGNTWSGSSLRVLTVED